MPPPPDDVIADLLRRLLGRQPACGGTRVLAIDGPSGAGKTSLAAVIAERSDANVLHLEDLYRGWRGLETGPTAAAEILTSLATGETGRAPRWDWVNSTTGDDLMVRPTALLIVEGVGAGARALTPFTNLLVWVDADETERRRRALARDGDVYAPWWQVWADQERVHFAREGTASRAEVHLSLR